MNASKIIKGVVGGGRYTVTAPIIKEDYGLYLQIEGIELPETYEVDFSNDEHSGTSVTMIGNADGVLIPSQFISSGKDVFAFLYHVGEDYGRTIFKFRIPNKLRPDRTNEQPTPEEQSVIDQTISALNDAVESAQDAQEAIENMSVSAQTLAEGESATVTKTESEGVVHLAFGIPTGATGAQGERGEKGDKGDTGEVTQAEFDELSGEVTDLKSGLSDLEETIDGIIVKATSKNLYDKTSCDPADKHTYNSSGVYSESNSFATSGKIPVEGSTQYTFSANGEVKNVRYFKGDTGEIFISGENTTGTFTTPDLCTYVAVQLFARSHTTEQYEAAIAVAQLELGDTATPYEPYGGAPYVSIDSLDKGEEISALVATIDSATPNDVGKALKAKTVSDGKVTGWEFGEAGDADLRKEFDEVLPTVVGKNLYDKETESHENDKMYDLSNGIVKAAAAYAVTGKISVESSTQYIFSAGGVRVKHVVYFSGDDGETFISSETINDAAFTTPSGCTYIGINLFAGNHTAEQYEQAIAVAQLEKGSVATAYEPYSNKRVLNLENLEDGEKLGGLSEIVESQSQVNLYDKTLAVNGKYYSRDGSVQTSADWAITGFIPVTPNTQYNISRDPNSPMPFGGSVKLYDANKTYIGNATLGGYVYNNLYAFSTDASTRFIGVGLKLSSHTEQDFIDTINTIMLCYGTQRPSAYHAYDMETVLPASKIGNAYQTNPDCFTGKKWLATGTSITWYDGKAYQAGVNAGELCRGYIGNVSRRKKLLVTNEGISGSTLANVSESSLINRYQNLDWAGTDIATIEYGVNDFGHAIEIGTADEPAGNTTFASCLKTIIEYALTQNPKLCLVICTEPDVRGTNANTAGHYLYEYTDVTLAIAKQYRLPVCDWFYKSGINGLNKGGQTNDWMTADGTHPNDAGHMRMGAMLNQVFDSLMC